MVTSWVINQDRKTCTLKYNTKCTFVESLLKIPLQYYIPVLVKELLCFVYTFTWKSVTSKYGLNTIAICENKFRNKNIFFFFGQSKIIYCKQFPHFYTIVLIITRHANDNNRHFVLVTIHCTFKFYDYSPYSKLVRSIPMMIHLCMHGLPAYFPKYPINCSWNR